ncbi:MAG: hypothetical protein ABS911_05435 [Carnobacterium sp.]
MEKNTYWNTDSDCCCFNRWYGIICLLRILCT